MQLWVIYGIYDGFCYGALHGRVDRIQGMLYFILSGANGG